ncbi:MAG: hypothetical protein K1X63_12520 [Chitinophagales bacterium]|nr:hypothetical protein [Bacteroidota bacterium]MBX7141895.1 hypothetical protein [Chitinophagales bacterium]
MKAKFLVLWVANALFSFGQLTYAQQTSPLLPEVASNPVTVPGANPDSTADVASPYAQQPVLFESTVVPDALLHARMTLRLVHFVKSVEVDENSDYHFEGLRCELADECPVTLY